MEQHDVFSLGAAGVLTLADLADLLAAGHDPRGRSDFMLGQPADGRPDPAPTGSPTPAAVLVALMRRASGLTVLLTQRTAHLAHHPGQIAFPGGRLDPGDDGDLVACALRETEEEVGLSPEGVVVLGRLDDYVTGTGFVITPVVGMARPPQSYMPDPFEVAEVFEVPLEFLADPANYRLARREVAGRERQYWVIEWEQRLIWGATAGILVNFAEILARRGR